MDENMWYVYPVKYNIAMQNEIIREIILSRATSLLELEVVMSSK
jgi:hypothetical protein